MDRVIDQVSSATQWEQMQASGKKLTIKYGVDVTAPFLHLGHAVNLWMMRELQEQGHKVIFLIGDFTTRIGDPTGKSAARVVPSRSDIDRNANEFIKQVGYILIQSSDCFEVRRNSEWYDEMGLDEFISLLSMVTHSRLIQRDMFQQRINKQKEIWMHELLYPVLQAYDSKMLNSDLTIVGSDQLFNEMLGRFYQEKFGQKPQLVITSKITPGTDGKEKQSKSIGNYIALEDSPRDKFGKVMSIPDSLTIEYLKIYTIMPLAEIQEIQKGIFDSTVHPMTAKKLLASSIVKRYHGDVIASSEQQWFESSFSQRKTPVDMPEVVCDGRPLLDIIDQYCIDRSRANIRRLAKQGAISIDGKKLNDQDILLPFDLPGEAILKVGKRIWLRCLTPQSS